MKYNKIRKMDIANGPGIRVSIFMQGCSFHCEGCFSEETWNFNTGKDFTESLVRISFKDKTGTIISDMDMTIPAILEGNTISVNAATTADVVNSKDIVIELVEQ